MAQIFISYASPDEEYALQTYHYLKDQGYGVWLAPFEIRGGRDFSREIARELNWDQIPQQDEARVRQGYLEPAQAVVFLLSKAAMESPWVSLEVNFSVSRQKALLPLQIDHAPLRNGFEFVLQNTQIIPAYHLPPEALEVMRQELCARNILPTAGPGPGIPQHRRIPLRELAITPIAAGDPYFLYGQTMRVSLRKGAYFFLAPPAEGVPEDRREWAAEHFQEENTVFGAALEPYCAQIPGVPDLVQRIEESRRKVFRQFLSQENGTYYNNKKFGIYSIAPFVRTEDQGERACLELELFTTDYFTHRVMKEVCKELYREGHPHFRNLSYAHLGADRIFFTSLGINLLLLSNAKERERSVLLCDRSVNASETYGQVLHSVSVIEGVSATDYEAFSNTVLLTEAVARGLEEELGIEREEALVAMDTLRFYQLFVNEANLEVGLACSVELKGEEKARMEAILPLQGKDSILEVAGKRVLPVRRLRDELLSSYPRYLSQAAFAIGAYLEAVGQTVFDRQSMEARLEEAFVQGKAGGDSPCGDAVFQGKHFMAVIDGATPKGTRLWDGLPGDVFVARLLCRALEQLPLESTAEEAVTFFNKQIADAYAQAGTSLEELPPEERLQASILVASSARREVWSFGDCKLRINGTNYDHSKRVDWLLSSLRAFYIELCRLKGLPTGPEDVGRMQILPYLKDQALFANYSGPFGYDVLDGGAIDPSHVVLYTLSPGDHVILASDGYPELFDSLQECEDYLARALRIDPECTGLLIGTKRLNPGCVSFDDRAFLSFLVK